MRDDDREEIVRKRLDVYHQQTEPLVNFYKSLEGDSAPAFVEVSGMGSLEAIREQLINSLTG